MTASYRIEVQRNLHMRYWPWEASVYPTGGSLPNFAAAHLMGKTRDEAVEAARDWIREESALDRAHETLYVDERGEQVTP